MILRRDGLLALPVRRQGRPYRLATVLLRGTIIFFMCALLFEIPLWANQDPVLICKKKYDHAKEIYLNELRQIETDFMTFRWTEAKIRDLYYHYFGPTRQDRHHPLAKNKREEAKAEEGRLLKVLKAYEETSEAASNGVLSGIKSLKNGYIGASKACLEYAYESCVIQTFESTYAMLNLLERDFEQVFERERNYRKAVEGSVSGRDGLYQEDALDISDQEADYYWRFEAEKEMERYADNKRVIAHFHKLYRFMTHQFAGDRCCYQCSYLEERGLNDVEN